MNAPIQPLEGWILIEPIEPTRQETKSGLVLNIEKDEAENYKNRGLVVGIPKESPVSLGCTIFFKPYAGQIAYVDNKKYILIEFQDVCGVLKE